MKKIKKSYLLLLFMAFTLSVQSQVEKGYYFEGDEVVFEFDISEYKELTKHNSNKKLDFDDLDIYEVAIAGDFNNWSRKNWKMEKVGKNRYQLRKKITDFNDAFKWEFKYIVNGKYWAEPKEDIINKSKLTYHNKFWKDVYNMDLFTITATPDGNARFFLPDHNDAQKVTLSGSFIDWDDEGFPMKKMDNGWEVILDLPPDRYEYKFIVDGNWMEDPNNPDKVLNQYHTWNSVLDIYQEVTFLLEGYEKAESVILTGSFSNWDMGAYPMHREGNIWVRRLELTGGKHWYKFIIDGEWITDPENPIKEHDGSGHINSVIMIQ